MNFSITAVIFSTKFTTAKLDSVTFFQNQKWHKTRTLCCTILFFWQIIIYECVHFVILLTCYINILVTTTCLSYIFNPRIRYSHSTFNNKTAKIEEFLSLCTVKLQILKLSILFTFKYLYKVKEGNKGISLYLQKIIC